MLRARPRAGNLVLQNDEGIFAKALGRGPPGAMCAKDAQVIYKVPVAESYCTEGVDADVVLFPVMGQKIKGVAGWGVSAGADQHGRPILMIVGWSVPTTTYARSVYNGSLPSGGANCRHESAEDKARSLVLHEIVHGLGFNIFTFQVITRTPRRA